MRDQLMAAGVVVAADASTNWICSFWSHWDWERTERLKKAEGK